MGYQQRYTPTRFIWSGKCAIWVLPIFRQSFRLLRNLGYCRANLQSIDHTSRTSFGRHATMGGFELKKKRLLSFHQEAVEADKSRRLETLRIVQGTRLKLCFLPL